MSNDHDKFVRIAHFHNFQSLVVMKDIVKETYPNRYATMIVITSGLLQYLYSLLRKKNQAFIERALS